MSLTDRMQRWVLLMGLLCLMLAAVLVLPQVIGGRAWAAGVDTTTTVGSSNNSSTYGDLVTFTATVNNSSATGNVQFYDGLTLLGTNFSLSSGNATWAMSTLNVSGSPHTITAIYSGDLTFLGSTGTLSGNQTVTAKAIEVTPNASQTKVYGETDPTFTYTNTSLVGSDTFTGLLNRSTGEAVGTTYAIGLGNLSAGTNYSVTLNTTTVNFSITTKAITVTPDAGQTKAYGASDPTFTYTNTSLVGSDTFTGNLSRVAGETIGTYNITIGDLSAGANYSVTFNATPVTFAITTKTLTVTATGPSKIYGTALTAGTSATNFTAVGNVSGESVTNVTLTPDAAGLLATTAALATYNVTPSLAMGTGGFLASNYNITYTNFSGTVSKKALTVTADNKSKVDGTANPDFTATATGLVGTDNLSSLSLGYTLNTTATTISPAGTYNITITGGAASTANYSPITYVNGSLTVTSGGGTGGGGGGGGSSVENWEICVLGQCDKTEVNSLGKIMDEFRASSTDRDISVYIAEYTKMKGADGKRLAGINIEEIDTPPAPPAGYVVLKAFDFNPDGATFDPGIQITITFDPSQVAPGETVVIAYYNETTGEWQFIEGTVTEDGQAVFVIEHCSIFGVLASVVPALQPTPTAAPAVTPSGGGLGAGALIGIVIGVLVVLALAVYFILGKKFGWRKAGGQNP